MPDTPDDAMLKDLAARVAKATAEHRQDVAPDGQGGKDMSRGLKISAELIAGIVVGAFLGWASDKWLGTKPWGLIVGFLLGTCAGFMNVYRAVQNAERGNTTE
jgi:ATP synthase protein I